MVKLKGLSKFFTTDRGLVKAVDDIDIEVKEGEFFTLLGPSGCGKSTTLRCIAGLERPDYGEITIGEEMVFSAEKNHFIPASKRDIAMVFQSYAIWPHMNVYANVAYPLQGKMPKKAVRDQVMEVLDMVGIKDLESRPAPQLSGGQQQRVAVARAIVKGAKVLLFDEPLSNLDAKMRIHMRVELRELQNRLGITFIYVTHDQEEAISLSDRVAVMDKGRIIELASPADIYLKPRDHFTADFIGACNFLPGKVLNTEKDSILVGTEIGELSCLSPENTASEVVVGIRPEHIEIFKKGEELEKNQNVVQGIVVSAVFLGSAIDCTVKAGSKLLKVQVLSSKYVTDGEEVHLYLPPQLCIALSAKK